MDSGSAEVTAPDTAGRPARKRVRAPEAHRAAILEAARAAFSERGFAKATIRDIAARAGVTHGLVMRHFSSKEALFIAAAPELSPLAEDIPGDAAGLPARVAQAYVRRMEGADSSDPMIAMIRGAAADEESARRLLAATGERAHAAYRAVLDLPDAEQRIDLLGALVIGVSFIRYVMREGPLAEMPPDDLSRYLTASLTGILQEPLPPGPP
ncbi:MAG TPA: TetR family transcriptional regulator [Trebonia sp.]|jgi:AcrR family transcriptional regulator|nr:TetR family transcriptional regulator [Trebonia sp.]